MFAQMTSGLDLHANALLVRAERQRAIASNIANADTPGYVARDVNFKDAMAAASGNRGLATALQNGTGNATAHPGHISIGNAKTAESLSAAGRAYTVQTQPSMDNNSVDLDRERASFVDNAVRYETTLRFINGYSKTMLSAIQGQ
ncbi:MAG: flagellar basal body rod protein FlgB [Rhodoferax sp.]|nr:flagellar basal body rod protein FlgB [Rhodoferax sp.]